MNIVIAGLLLTPSLISGAPPCNPPSPDIGGNWLCYPEVPIGVSIPENTHCILTCGKDSTLHTCSNGSWDRDPARIRCMENCPPIYGTDPSSQITCVPPRQGNNSAPEGTYCIYSCQGHPVDELFCKHGHWSDDPNHLTCSSSSTTGTTSSSTLGSTPLSTTTTPIQPPTALEKSWGFYYLGDKIGATGIIILENGSFIVGSGTGSDYQGNKKLSLLEKAADTDDFVVTRELNLNVEITKIARLYPYDQFGVGTGLDLIIVGTGDGKLILVFPDLSGVYDIIDGGVKGQEIKDIITFHPDLHKQIDIVVVGENYLNIFKNTTHIAHIEHHTPEKIAFGRFMDYPATQFVKSDGEVYELPFDFQSVSLIGSFGLNFGRMGSCLEVADVDGDQIDEIIGCYRGIEAYSALDFVRIWNHEIDIRVDALIVHDVDNDGVLDIVYGDDQWGNIYALDSKTGEEFWSKRNPEWGVTALAAGDFDGDGNIEIAWVARGDNFYIVDVETQEQEWENNGLEGPFYGYEITWNPNKLEYEILLTSSRSQGGGGLLFALDFNNKTVIWSKDNGDSWSGVNALEASNVDEDGSVEVITFGSRTYDGRVYVMDIDDGNLKFTTKLDEYLLCGLLEDMNNDGQMEILAGDSIGGIEILNGNDGSEYGSYSQIGSGGIKQLATTRNDQNVVDKILALTGDGVWKIYTENDHVGKVGNSSHRPTSITSLFLKGWKIIVGDADGRLHTLDEELHFEDSFVLCEGPITHLQAFRDSEISFTCENNFGLVDTVSHEILVRQFVRSTVWRAQAYNISDQLYFLTGGEVVELWSQVS